MKRLRRSNDAGGGAGLGCNLHEGSTGTSKACASGVSYHRENEKVDLNYQTFKGHFPKTQIGP